MIYNVLYKNKFSLPNIKSIKMKKFVIFLFLVCNYFIGQAQDVNTKNWILIHERTATWCPHCGTWGWTMKEQIFDKYADENVLFMAVHHSGDLMNTTSVEFDKNFGGSGQPLFFVDGVNINANSNNIATKIEETQWEIDYKKNENTLAGVGIKATLDPISQLLSVDAKIEFLTELESGDYYFGLYLLEDVLNRQESRTGLQLHKNVLRKSLLTNVFNNPLQSGKIDKGTTFTLNGSAMGLTAAAEKYKIAGVIWTKVGNNYRFFNANLVNVVGVSTSSDISKADKDFDVYQSESGNIILSFKNEKFLNNSIIQITDISGKVLATSNIDGQNTQTISVPFLPGMHIVTIKEDRNVVSKKIVLQ